MSGRATILYAFEVTGKGKDALKEIAGRIGDVNRNFTGARKGLNQFADWAYEQTDALGTVKEWRDYLLELAGSVHEVLKMNKQYARSWEVLTDRVKAAGKAVADAIGPHVAKMVGNFAIGFDYLATAIPASLNAIGGFIRTWYTNTYTAAFDSTNAIIKMVKDFLLGNVVKLDPIVGIWDDFKANSVAMMEQLGKDMVAAHERGQQQAFKTFKALQRPSPGKRPVAGTPNEAIAILNTAQAALSETVPQLEAWGDSLIAALEEQAGKTARIVEGVMSVGTGSLSSVLSAIGGPVGALVGSVIDLVKNAPETLMAIFGEIFDLYVNADDWIAQIVQQFVPMVIRVLPVMIAQFATLIPEIALTLVAAIPAIVAALIEGMIGIIPAFINAFAQMFRDFVDQIKAAVNPFGKSGSIAAGARNFGSTVGGVVADVGRFLGVGRSAPSAANEGTIMRTGLIVAHKGERISHPRSAYDAQGAGPRYSVGNVYITTPDPRAVFQEFRRLQGTGGIGLRADALGGF